MDFNKYIGFKLDDVKPMLELENLNYKVIEVWDTKNTKMGDDIRIINIKCGDTIDIYVSYF